MKKRRIIQRPDGTKEIYEEHDEAPAMKKLAAAGQRGDTELAHVNRWEEELLKRLGGVGTRNPLTGLKQFYASDYAGTQLYAPEGYTYDNAAAPTGTHWEYNAQTGERVAKKTCPPKLGVRGTDASGNEVIASTLGGATQPYSPVTTTSVNQSHQGMTGDPNYSPVTATSVTASQHGMTGDPNTGDGVSMIDTTRYYTPVDTNTGNGAGTSVANPYVNTTPSTTSTGTNTGTTPTTGTGNMPSYLSGDKIKGDFAAYFSNPANIGKTYAWPGGNGEQITLGADGYAVLTSPTGSVIARFNKDTPLQNLYAIPAIGNAWDKQFGGGTTNTGGTTTGGGATTGGGTGTGVNGFDIPTNIMPTSGGYSTLGGTSQNTSNNSAFNMGSSGGTSTSNQNASNYSGLPTEYRDAIMKAIMPQLGNAVTNMEGNYDKYTNQALSSYQNMMNNALKQSIPQVLSGMANRGIINSTEAQKIMGGVLSDAAISASDKGYQTAMQQALLKANMPTVLGGLAQLGQSTQGQSTGQSLSNQFSNTVGSSMGSSQGTSNNYGLSENYSQDPTVMYRTIADLIKAMM